MRTTIIALSVALSTLFAGSAVADAPAKAKRPVLCSTATVMSGGGKSVLVCLDGQKPRMFSRYVKVEFSDEHGSPKSYFLGWPTITPPVRSSLATL